MKTNPHSYHSLLIKGRLSPAFALPAVLIISAGVLILLVTLMTIVDLERTTSKARLGSYQADLAVESGFEEAKMILAGVTASDTYAVGVIPFAEAFDDNDDGSISSEEDGNLSLANDERGRPYLYAIQGEVEGGAPSYRMTPLFSTDEGPRKEGLNLEGELALPDDPGLSDEEVNNLENRVAVRGTPYLQAPVTSWRIVEDEEGVPIARYSYWVEDMQGYLDAERVGGNQRKGGTHGRANEVWESEAETWNSEISEIATEYISEGGVVPLWPAPGLNPSYVQTEGEEATAENSPLSEVAVYTLDQKTGGRIDETEFDDTIRDLAPKAPTPASLLALSGVEAPLDRVPDGADRGRMELKNSETEPEPRWIEESFVTGNQSWEEFALIPFAPGIDPSVMGTPRLNLNEKLAELDGVDAATGTDTQREVVEEITEHIQTALPRFASQRRGGFGDWNSGEDQDKAYLRNIAASIIDYADIDGVPTVDEGQYRGIDSSPLVTEHLITHRYDSFEKRDGANFIVIGVEIFVELWNMSNYPITGQYELGYSNPYVFEALGNPEVDFMSPLDNTTPSSSQSWSSHTLRKDEDARWYSAPTEVTIPSNGYTLVKTGEIMYHLLVSPDGTFLPLPIELTVVEQGETNYRLKWNNVICDRSGAGMELTSLKLNSAANLDQITRAVICGTWGAFNNFYTGPYDPRHSWWAGLDNEEGVVSENSYPRNYNPGRRTVRYAIVRNGNEDELYGRMLVSEWPDGGHDAGFAVNSFHKKTGTTSDRALRPDSDTLYKGDVEPESDKAPVFISNLGRYFSETELGNIYDPLMWRNKSNPTRTNEIWFRGSINATRNNNVPEVEEASKKATVVGGGNTLRIGRPEHTKFDDLGERASQLLDLFHCGEPFSTVEEERIGQKRSVDGQVNINTASREVLRALVAGILVADTELGSQSTSFDTNRAFAPRVSGRYEDIAATDGIESEENNLDEGGAIADAIIAARPFVSRSQLASLVYPSTVSDDDLVGKPVFGNKLNHEPAIQLQWSDRASEEVFARLYNSTTVRSRNFRVHVVGQALEQTPSGNLRIKATRKRSFRVFVNPGDQQSESGQFDSEKISVETSYETNL